MFVRANFADIYLRGMRELAREIQCRLTAFLHSIYLINWDRYSSAIPILCRLKNSLNCPPFFRNFNPTCRLRVASKPV